MSALEKLYYQLIDSLTDHLKSCDESYFQHLRIAFSIGSSLVLAGMACVVHSVFPFLFTHTAGNTVRKINKYMDFRKNNKHINRS